MFGLECVEEKANCECEQTERGGHRFREHAKAPCTVVRGPLFHLLEVTVRPWERVHLISLWESGRSCPLPALASLSHTQRNPAVRCENHTKPGVLLAEAQGNDPSSPVFNPGVKMGQCGFSRVKLIAAKAQGGQQGHSGQSLNNTDLSPLGYILSFLFKLLMKCQTPVG